MTELVTDAAIDAASEAVFANRGLADDPLIPVLNAAAPFIAAQALRKACIYICPDDTGAECRAELNRVANKLEDDAAFTGMVQLGQEMGDE